ncbi:hypothetical protein NOF04DRAFT_1363561 [Fusarium oxysporum II5]|nr:hypothetical protein NOF04DRAFT_1363561 [Fusarium oxysporum II5]
MPHLYPIPEVRPSVITSAQDDLLLISSLIYYSTTRPEVWFGSFYINKVMPPMTTSDRPEKKSVAGPISRLVIRTLQCIFAIVVAVLYGLDLQHATDHNVRAGSAWIYAELVAGVSMIICIVDLLFTTAGWYWCLLDGLVFVLWVAQFGTLASIYLGTGDPAKDREFERLVSRGRMRAAVWINLGVAVIGGSHNKR